MERAMITIWPDNEAKMNQIRGELLKKGHKLKQSTLINVIMQKYFEEHPKSIEDPMVFIEDEKQK